MPVKNKTILIISILLILSGVSLLGYVNFKTPDYLSYNESDFSEEEPSKKKKEKKESKKEIPKPIKVISKETENSKETDLPKVEEKTIKKEAETKLSKPKKEEKQVNEIKTQSYYIISGCFSTNENAETHVEQLKKDGFSNAIVIGKVNDLFNVSFGKYNSRESAEKDLEKIKEKFQSSAWILYI